MTKRDTDVVRMVSATADFYPEDAPEGFFEWTFLVPRTAGVGAGLYELRFVRALTPEELAARDYRAATGAPQ